MRPQGSPEALEQRRRRVVKLLEQDLSLHEIARRVGCHASSVLRWRNALGSGGADALKAKPAPGRPPKLTSKEKAKLVKLLAQGAMAHGYRTELWTTQRIATLIEHRVGVRYHRNHVGKLLHQLGWSHQKPQRRAVERDEAAIAEWKDKVWPAVKKRRKAGSPHRLCRRIGLPLDPHRTENLEPCRTDPCGAALLSSRPHLRDLRHCRQPQAPALYAVLPFVSGQHPGRRGESLPASSSTPSPRSSGCSARQW
jgi:transposase